MSRLEPDDKSLVIINFSAKFQKQYQCSGGSRILERWFHFLAVVSRCRGLLTRFMHLKSMQSNEIRHNSAINMMTVGVASILLKIPERLIQTRFKMNYCAKGN